MSLVLVRALEEVKKARENIENGDLSEAYQILENLELWLEYYQGRQKEA